jgi:hypothetical protein
MHNYEIRIIQAPGSPSLITAEIHLSDESAIRSARKLARGKQFEVWRGLVCITGFATTQVKQPAVASSPSVCG